MIKGSSYFYTICDRCGRHAEIFRTDNWTIDVVTKQRRTEWLCAECRDKDERRKRK